MRTTLVIDDDVLAAARRKALDLDLTPSELVTRALRRSFDEPAEASEQAFVLPTWGDPAQPQHVDPTAMVSLADADDRAGLGQH